MTHSANLLPVYRVRALERRDRVRLWLRFGGAYGVCVVLGSLLYALGHAGPGAAELSRDLPRIAARDTAIARTSASLRDDIAAAQHHLGVARKVGRNPNWSIPLAMIAESCGDEVILRSCALGRTSAGNKPDGPRREGQASAFGYRLELLGYGRTQSAVSQLVLKLETSALFDAVSLLETRREPFLDQTAVAFRIECRITPEGKHE
ncbi:MAG: PilN domain-containing protein [Planctomycetota bacterium]